MKRIQLEQGIPQILLAAVSYSSYLNLYQFDYKPWALCRALKNRRNG